MRAPDPSRTRFAGLVDRDLAANPPSQMPMALSPSQGAVEACSATTRMSGRTLIAAAYAAARSGQAKQPHGLSGPRRSASVISSQRMPASPAGTPAFFKGLRNKSPQAVG